MKKNRSLYKESRTIEINPSDGKPFGVSFEHMYFSYGITVADVVVELFDTSKKDFEEKLVLFLDYTGLKLVFLMTKALLVNI